MLTTRLSIAAVMAALLGLGSSSANADDSSWIGKTVIVKKPGTKFGVTDKDGKQVYLGDLSLPHYQVIDESKDWIGVSQYGKAGWVDKNDVVMLDDAVKYFTARIKQSTKDSSAFAYRAIALHLKGELNGALVDYEEAIRLDPKNLDAYAQEAWLLATSPDPKARDGKKAVELSRKLCEMSDWKKPHYLGILAAAYAEDGKFDEAVKYQEKALEDPDYSANWGREALKWLSLYKAKKPNHQK